MKLALIVLLLSVTAHAGTCNWKAGKVVSFENHGWKSGGYSTIVVTDGQLSAKGEHEMGSAFSSQAHFTENSDVQWCEDGKHLRVREGKATQKFNLVSKRTEAKN